MGEIEYSFVDLVGSIVPLPEDERINSFEEMCISYYLERFPYEGGPSFVIRRFGRNVGSKGVRSALILDSICYLRKRHSVLVDRHQELSYRGQCYHHMQADIAQNKFIDLVYACYHLCQYLYENEIDSPIEEISKHVAGLYLSVKRVLDTRDIDLRERQLLHSRCAIAGSYFLSLAYQRTRNPINAAMTLATLKGAIALDFWETHCGSYLSSVLHFILLENLGFHVATTREKSNQGLVGEIHHFIRELYDSVRRPGKFWNMIQEQKQFCDPECPAIFSSPWAFDDLYDPWRILLHSELYFLSVIFELHSPHIKPFEINDVETALLVCRLSYIKQDARASTICPRCSIPAHALFLAGLFLAKTPFTEGVNAFPI
jgi:hypothetical protein